MVERIVQQASWTGLFVVKRKDGTSFMARGMDMPVRDDAGELIGIIGISSRVDRPHRQPEQRAERG